ncbi:MAG: cytochrome-c peroxidase [Lacibacter sp.]|jgi:cytochrome c peroxidase
MKKSTFLVFLFMIAGSALLICQCNTKQTETDAARTEVLAGIEQLQQFLKDTMLPLAMESDNSEVLQTAFRTARKQYKKMEWAVEYFMPTTARFVNGPALDELELEENKAVPPEGFQVIEELIHPLFDTGNREELIRNIKIITGTCERMKQHFNAISFSKEQVIDAMRLQLYRIITLGITGFDMPVALRGVEELPISLNSLKQLLQTALSPVQNKNELLFLELLVQYDQAIAFCSKPVSFNDFNRALFITQYINPLCEQLHLYQQEEQIAFVQDGRVYKTAAATLFDAEGFDVNGFTPAPEYIFTNEKARLGERLFYDNILSVNNNRNCGSCHQPERAFSDGLKTSASLNGGFIQRNAPSLSYAALQHGQFWDMRRTDLETQSADVIENKEEMHGSLKEAVIKLQQHKEYKTLFAKAFPSSAAIEPWQVQNALASYIRSLANFNSRFDAYMRGDANTMNTEEVHGFNLFMGKAKCGTCHFMPLFNGTVPPNFQKTESEVLGTPADAGGTQPDADEGRWKMHPLPQLLQSFKTPTVRNAALTAPYMHNGVYRSLKELLQFYNKGGGEGLGLKTGNQTLPADTLGLTAAETKAIIAFIHTLNDAPKPAVVRK